MQPFTVGIYHGYDYPDLRRQTPEQDGRWNKIRFLIDKIDEPCDILVVLNNLKKELKVECGEVWQIVQEPPIDKFPWSFEGQEPFDKIYSPLCPKGVNCQPSHGALPWHLEMTYSDLKNLAPIEKNKSLSWVTTNKRVFQGHKKRMKFLNLLRKSNLGFDLFGRGFNPLADKYEALGPYRYSLAVENFRGPHYWTEKVADCFLSWTMPIYYGCTNLVDYFPKESFIQIDIEDPKTIEKIKEIVKTDLYLKNRDAIAEARKLILEKFQLFPFISDRITKINCAIKPRIFYPYKNSFKSKVKRKLKRLYAG